MYMVKIGETIHSAWITRAGAKKQVEALENVGYTNVTYQYCQGVKVENGTYFV